MQTRLELLESAASTGEVLFATYAGGRVPGHKRPIIVRSVDAERDEDEWSSHHEEEEESQTAFETIRVEDRVCLGSELLVQIGGVETCGLRKELMRQAPVMKFLREKGLRVQVRECVPRLQYWKSLG